MSKQIYKCKFCNKEQKTPLSKGYCVSCYQYFIMHKYEIWPKSKYGQIDTVLDIRSDQFGMCICHICGKAYTKLQQHIYYVHKMSKKEYCDKFGLNHNIQMTSTSYNSKMRDYALNYKMDDQLRRTGLKTRFKKGHNLNYKRSYQTLTALSKRGKLLAQKYSIKKEV